VYLAEVPPAWPEDEYLIELGKLIYSIASLEGLLLSDLPRMPTTIAELSPKELAGHTTTGIGRQLLTLAPSIQDRAWREYIGRGGEALVDLGPKRNSILHARPATIDGRRRLHRWRLEPTEIMPISLWHLGQLLDEIEAHRQVLTRLRPPL
jgi:hypothetical protein